MRSGHDDPMGGAVDGDPPRAGAGAGRGRRHGGGHRGGPERSRRRRRCARWPTTASGRARRRPRRDPHRLRGLPRLGADRPARGRRPRRLLPAVRDRAAQQRDVRGRRGQRRQGVDGQPLPVHPVRLGRPDQQRGRALREHRQPGVDLHLLLAGQRQPRPRAVQGPHVRRPTPAAPTTTAGTAGRTPCRSRRAPSAERPGARGGSTWSWPTAGTAPPRRTPPRSRAPWTRCTTPGSRPSGSTPPPTSGVRSRAATRPGTPPPTAPRGPPRSPRSTRWNRRRCGSPG